jgi:hypothetical protein
LVPVFVVIAPAGFAWLDCRRSEHAEFGGCDGHGRSAQKTAAIYD